MRKASNEAIDGELRFLRQYKDAILCFNLLDWNMGYCLSWAARFEGAVPEQRKIFSLSYDEKLKKVRSLIKTKNREDHYQDFTELADRCRLFRNRLVHGRWDFKDWLEKPIYFKVAAPFEEDGYLTHDEFSAQTAIFEKTLMLFNRKRETHSIEGPVQVKR